RPGAAWPEQPRAEAAPSLRLACQFVPEGDVALSWEEGGLRGGSGAGPAAAAAANNGAQILSGSVERTVPIQPAVHKVFVALPPPCLEDQRSDLDRLLASLAEATAADSGAGLDRADGPMHAWIPRDHGGAQAPLEADPSLLPFLPAVLRREGYRVTAVLRGRRLMAVEPGDTRQFQYGMAFDIGTTTVVGYLMDLRSGRQLAVASRYNPQAVHGADVVSRLTFADQQGTGRGTRQLQQEILQALAGLTRQCLAEAHVNGRYLYEYTVAGNTCMHHLALGIHPASLATSPYVPAVTGPVEVPAASLGLPGSPGAVAWFFPNVAVFVGGDTVAVGLAANLLAETRPTLAIDVGTNGEMVLTDGHRLVACSTAAGPAFEGAAITFGMRAETGAIDRVWLGPDDDLRYHVLGGGEPRGICGSGMVDLVAVLLDAGVISASGRFVPPPEDADKNHKGAAGAGSAPRPGVAGAVPPPAPLLRRLRTVEGQTVVLLSPDGSVYFSQQDVRQLQLAKGAIQAGYSILAKELGMDLLQLDQVVLAGAFGNYLSPSAARRIGLLPPLPLDKIVPIGNGAGAGAQMALLSQAERSRAEEFRRRTEYVELSARSDFFSIFSECLAFPECSTVSSRLPASRRPTGRSGGVQVQKGGPVSCHDGLRMKN
ncbi:MAG: DUF4445 domain-containing protein, partial [Firmicutes bacterium]|nr:DUF4445 domain-containing protein [Bacillota bacterium]